MQTIAMCSFKGGTAKTSTALHFGSALSLFHGARVLLIDFDAQANLTAGMGFDPDEHDSLAPVLQGTKHIDEVIQQSFNSKLHFIPGDTWLERVEITGHLAADRYSHELLKNLLEPLEYDYVVIDTPPSLCWLTESALIAADHALICATPEFYSVKGLERLAEFIRAIAKRHPLEVLGVVLSFWHARGKSNETFIDLIERTFPNKLLKTKIRRDITISQASVYGKPVFQLASAGRGASDYEALTQELLERLSHVKDCSVIAGEV